MKGIRQKMRKNAGITLIALVVTIIVLLILAGVTLSLIGGSEGILGRATHAVDENNKAMAKEQIELAVSDYQTEFYEAKYVEQTNDGTKKEYILKKLQVETYTEKYRVVTSEEGNVKVYEKDSVSRNPVVTGKVQEDGSIKWDDEIEMGTPDEPEKENPVTVTLTAEYVGTSSFTVKIDASSTEGNIVNYQYQINGGEVKTTTESKFTIEDLEPTTNYPISVVAIDENGNENKALIEITTKARTYIIESGTRKIAGQAKNANITDQNGYSNLVVNSIAIRGGWYFNYDVSKFKKIKIDVEVTNAASANMIDLFLCLSDPLTASVTQYGRVTIKNVGLTEKKRDIYSIDISALNGNFMIACLKNIASSAASATVHIYNLWLEE